MSWNSMYSSVMASIRKAVSIASRSIPALIGRSRDSTIGTYSRVGPAGELHRYLNGDFPWNPRLDSECVRALTDNYLAHRFDLLGSGWVQVKHDMRCRGLEGHVFRMGSSVCANREGAWLEGRINASNLGESKRIWGMVDEAYAPIDWQLDFKSGYRWKESTWYQDIRHGSNAGVDIKVPWELSRMQHLVQLALAYGFAKEGFDGFRRPEQYAREFANQLLDFIAANPPRFGVNWRFAIEVGTRVSNWLISADLFRTFGADFGREFEAVFIRSVYEHGRHIVDNLERSHTIRGNHYLAGIVSLVFAAAYLPRNPETDAWLAFGVRELIEEVEFQFGPDGGNFEGSFCYHRLSAEMVLYATALILGLPEEKQKAILECEPGMKAAPRKGKPTPLRLYRLEGCDRFNPFPYRYLERLYRIARFTKSITKPNGMVPQVGDNDSGRFFKLQPVYEVLKVSEARSRYANLSGYFELDDNADYWAENHLDHRHLVAAANGLFDRPDLAAFGQRNSLESRIVRNLAGGTTLRAVANATNEGISEDHRVGSESDRNRIKSELDTKFQQQRCVYEILIPGASLRTGLELCAFPVFGFYIFRSERLYLGLRCGAIGQNGRGGHAHNDQLSMELNVDGADWITDPGTYLYTPLPEIRNRYRSVKAHFSPQLDGKEPARLDQGLFRLGNDPGANCLCFVEEGFIGLHFGYGVPVYRLVEIHENSILIVDYNLGESCSRTITRESLDALHKIPVSPGYGVVLQ